MSMALWQGEVGQKDGVDEVDEEGGARIVVREKTQREGKALKATGDLALAVDAAEAEEVTEAGGEITTDRTELGAG